MIKRFAVVAFVFALIVWRPRAPTPFCSRRRARRSVSNPCSARAAAACAIPTGTGSADAVVARVIVPAKPSREDVAGATTIAARLYETSPYVADRRPRKRCRTAVRCRLPDFGGRENEFVKKLVAQGSVDFKALKPGQGPVAVVRLAAWRPRRRGGRRRRRCGNAERRDRARRAAAAGMGDGRHHSRRCYRRCDEYLQSKGVSTARATVPSIVVDSDRRGIARLTLQVHVSDGEVARAAAAIKDLDTAHHRGQESKVLDFQNAARRCSTSSPVVRCRRTLW